MLFTCTLGRGLAEPGAGLGCPEHWTTSCFPALSRTPFWWSRTWLTSWARCVLSLTSGLPPGLGAFGSFLVADWIEMQVGEEGESLVEGKTRGRLESSLKVSSLLVEGEVETA